MIVQRSEAADLYFAIQISILFCILNKYCVSEYFISAVFHAIEWKSPRNSCANTFKLVLLIATWNAIFQKITIFSRLKICSYNYSNLNFNVVPGLSTSKCHVFSLPFFKNENFEKSTHPTYHPPPLEGSADQHAPRRRGAITYIKSKAREGTGHTVLTPYKEHFPKSNATL